MRIQAINTNTNFKGLFTDKTSQNNGNWRMEYSPYSWEKNSDGKIGQMANKAKFDVLTDKILPDNEEIFVRFSETPRAESSKDILGTESYFIRPDGRMRSTITEVPAMNREDSLKVLDQKYDRFLGMKDYLKRNLETNFDTLKNSADSASSDYNSHSAEHMKGMFERAYNKDQARRYMDQDKAALKNSTDKMYENAQKYIKLVNSMESVRNTKEKISKEINRLEELRKADKLIDISRQGIDNANAPLAEALQNIKAAAEKFICFPTKIVSMAEIMKKVNPRCIEGGYNNEIMRYVETLVRQII